MERDGALQGASTLREQRLLLGRKENHRRQWGPKVWPRQGGSRGGGEGGLTDVGVASDLAKDVCLPPRGFPHLLQLLRTQPLSCHLHDLHGKLMASGSVNASADHRAHPSARARERGQGSCSPAPCERSVHTRCTGQMTPLARQSPEQLFLAYAASQ